MAYPEEIQDLWNLVKDSFRSECADTAFDLWYGAIKLCDFDAAKNEIVFSTDSEFKLQVLNNKYKPLIEARFASVAGMEVSVAFKFVGTPTDVNALLRRIGAQPKAKESQSTPPSEENGVEMALRSRYTFDNFIQGDSNYFARSVCMRVAEEPFSVYNPLFLYGPSGVGKTHLMYAVINEIHKKKPGVRVLYTKGDDFINFMVDCLAHNNMAAFRDRYRNCDVLLLDDIQFVAGKVSTQTELFHTFQALFDAGKQIILASDRPPRDINPLEERLRSRFEQGLVTDINPPDLELRVAIIKKKSEDLGLNMPGEVLSYLSENLRSNIRQIEGAIKKLAAKSLVEGRSISLELARDCISDLLGDTEPLNVTVDKIFAAIYKRYNISKEDITGKKRNKEIAFARHIAVYLIREITEISFPNIGKMFERDHSTIMASYDAVKKRAIHDPLFASDIEELKKEVKVF